MKKLKVISFIIIIFIVILSIPQNKYAKYESAPNGSIIDPSNFDPNTNNPVTESDYNVVIAQTKTIVAVIRTVGIVVAVVGIIAIGIKYMVGSVEQRAEYKKTMIPYLIGCFLIFAITSIVSLIYSLTTNVTV